MIHAWPELKASPPKCMCPFHAGVIRRGITVLNSPGPNMAKAPFENYFPIRVRNDNPKGMWSIGWGMTQIYEERYLRLVPIICVNALELLTMILVS